MKTMPFLYQVLAATALAVAAPGVNQAQQMVNFRAISELLPEDNLTIPAEEIIKECTRVLERQPRTQTEEVCEAYKRRAVAYMQLPDKLERARADVDALCDLRPKDAEARCLRALVLAPLGEFAESQAEMEYAVKLQPRVPQYYAYLGAVLASRGKLREGLEMARRALKLDSDCLAAHCIVGMLSMAAGLHRACVDSLDRYIARRPCGSPIISELPDQVYCLRGIALQHLNRPRDALNSLLMAKRLRPSCYLAAWAIPMGYVDLGKHRAAARAADDLIRLGPPNAPDLFLHAILHARIGNRKIAEDSIGKGLAIMSAKEAKAAVMASGAYYAIGEYEKSWGFIDAALKIDPNYAKGLRLKAEIQSTCPLAKYRDGAAAVEVLERMYDAVKDNAELTGDRLDIMLTLAGAHAECGHFEQAIELMRGFLKLSGPERDNREYVQRLKLFESRKAYRQVGETGEGLR